jgi:hypothetical protein
MVTGVDSAANSPRLQVSVSAFQVGVMLAETKVNESGHVACQITPINVPVIYTHYDPPISLVFPNWAGKK